MEQNLETICDPVSETGQTMHETTGSPQDKKSQLVSGTTSHKSSSPHAPPNENSFRRETHDQVHVPTELQAQNVADLPVNRSLTPSRFKKECEDNNVEETSTPVTKSNGDTQKSTNSYQEDKSRSGSSDFVFGRSKNFLNDSEVLKKWKYEEKNLAVATNLSPRLQSPEASQLAPVVESDSVPKPTTCTDDEENHVKRPNYSFLKPDLATNKMIKENAQLSAACTSLPDIEAGGFPPLQEYEKWIFMYDSKPKTVIIYSSKEMRDKEVFSVGSMIDRPNAVSNSELGSGGNGTVFSCTINGRNLAVKLTAYRPNELNLWSKLSHRNVLSLLGVALQDRKFCFQIMPEMTTSLRRVMSHSGNLTELAKTNPLVCHNACYMFHEILCGLEYLHSKHIQHGDLKESNVLLLLTCKCGAFTCTCSVKYKCKVKIADFDSAKRSLHPVDASTFPLDKTKRMTDAETAAVCGTPLYRAPEQFLKPAEDNSILFKKVYEGSSGSDSVYNLEGPHCDVYMLGVIGLQVFSGDVTQADIARVSRLCQVPENKDVNPKIEGVLTLYRCKNFFSTDVKCVQPFIDFSKQCLEECNMRPKAADLLECDLFKCYRHPRR